MTVNAKIRVLVVDDEDSIRSRCLQVLQRHGYDAVGLSDGHSALKLLKDSHFDLIFTDIRMPGIDGLELLETVKRTSQATEVIMMTGYAAVESAVKAMKAGALDYLAKPFDVDELLHAVRRVAEKKALEREILQLKGQLKNHRGEPSIVGTSLAVQKVMHFVRKVAAVGCNVLLFGESGTGKEVVARVIHQNSPRRDRPFVTVDCAALSGSILGSELFGHVKGAFTGALADRKGYFESAEGGTLFLDEIGELPLELQGKLLRVVQEQVFVMVGATKPKKADVRIIAATHRPLTEMVASGKFREDLYYRLNVVHLTVPALRERRDDVPLLINYFLQRFAVQLDLPRIIRISEQELSQLSAYDWPGNVRELENAVQRALVMAEGDQLHAGDLIPSLSIEKFKTPELDLKSGRRQAVSEFTCDYLVDCLKAANGNVTHVANALGMRRTSLQRLLKKEGIDARSFHREAPPK